MKKEMKILTWSALLIALSVPAYAGSVWNAADSASPFVVRYTDAAKVGTIEITATGIVATDDSNANTLAYSASENSLTEVLAWINSATNATGTKNFEAKIWGGIGSDLVTNGYFGVLSENTLTKEWDYDVKWDTSNCLHYDSAAGVMVGSTPVQAGKIGRVFGDPIGTGNVTLSIYVDGSVKWSRLITSPVYVLSADATVNVAETSSAFDYEVNIDVGTQPAFVRASRATTATTGGIGLSVDAR
tara:strand:+ start:10225 stop:10956 length:732 start_codon:yes stop_codon:yes gene_type:complete